MKITSVDNYNINSNRTFRAKNINKAASKVNGKQVLDKFEKESNKIPPEFLVARNGCLISGGVLAFAAIFQMLHMLPFMVLPTAGIIAGIGYALISLSLNTPPKNKTYSTDDIIIDEIYKVENNQRRKVNITDLGSNHINLRQVYLTALARSRYNLYITNGYFGY